MIGNCLLRRPYALLRINGRKRKVLNAFRCLSVSKRFDGANNFCEDLNSRQEADADKKMSKGAIYSWLNLQSFSDKEIKSLSNQLVSYSEARMEEGVDEKEDNCAKIITVKGIQSHFKHRLRNRIKRIDVNIHSAEIDEYIKNEASLFMKSFGKSDGKYLHMHQVFFEDKLKEMASTVDYEKVFPISLSMILM